MMKQTKRVLWYPPPLKSHQRHKGLKRSSALEPFMEKMLINYSLSSSSMLMSTLTSAIVMRVSSLTSALAVQISLLLSSR